MPVLESLTAAFEPWSTLYSESTALSVGLTFAHLAAMMVGGGLALSADRTLLRRGSRTTAEERVVLAATLSDVHRPVVLALAVSALSGALQLAADIEALAVNRIMWIKFGLLLALAANGALMLRNEQAVRRDGGVGTAFGALRVHAITSVVLWLAITLAGVGLMQG